LPGEVGALKTDPIKDFVEETELVGRAHLAMAHQNIVGTAYDTATKGAAGASVIRKPTHIATLPAEDG
jgi:hypothetical protein